MIGIFGDFYAVSVEPGAALISGETLHIKNRQIQLTKKRKKTKKRNKKKTNLRKNPKQLKIKERTMKEKILNTNEPYSQQFDMQPRDFP